MGVAAPGTRSVILKYLVSTNDSTALYSLPIIPSCGGSYLSLTPGRDGTIYTLLEEFESAAFGIFDPEAICLSSLPQTAASLLRVEGRQGGLNVQVLDLFIVQRYMAQLHPLGMDLAAVSALSGATVDWLSKFWSWFGQCEWRSSLLPHLQSMYLLPARQSSSIVAEGVYAREKVHPKTVSVLETVGFPFLNTTFSLHAGHALRAAGTMRNCNDLRHILETFGSQPSLALPSASQSLLLGHLLLCQQSSPAQLDMEHKTVLHRLPIYPLVRVDALTGSSQPFTGAVTDTQIIVIRKAECPVLFNMQGYTYLDVPSSDRYNALLYLLDLSPPLPYVSLLERSIPHLASQPAAIQYALIEHLFRFQDSIQPKLITLLSQTSFLKVASGDIRPPGEVIDPNGSISTLYTVNSHPDQVPLVLGPEDSKMVLHLGELGVLQSKLTKESVLEYVYFLSSRPNRVRPLALSFLQLICQSPVAFQKTLTFPRDTIWLPAETEKLADINTCRDHQPDVAPKGLFDRVLMVLDSEVKLSNTLRARFGWDIPLPLTIIETQLDLVLSEKSPNHRTVALIITELSTRLGGLDIQRIRDITEGKAWVPTRGRKLAPCSSVVLSEGDHMDITEGLFELPWQTSSLEIRQFLLEMGCMERLVFYLCLNESLSIIPPALHRMP